MCGWIEVYAVCFELNDIPEIDLSNSIKVDLIRLVVVT